MLGFKFISPKLEILLIILFITKFAKNCDGKASKVSADCQRILEKGQFPNVIVELKKEHDTRASDRIRTLQDEISIVSKNPSMSRSAALTNLVHSLQIELTELMSPVINTLETMEANFHTLWLSREIYVPKASADVIAKLAEMDHVARIRQEGVFKRVLPPQPPGSRPPIEGNSTWNLGLIDARCKDITCLGDGVVLGFIDTGSLVTHVEIKDNWIGAPFGFFDGTANPPNCAARDKDGHGTHVTGTACGKNVGVAPHAKWMMCMGCTETNCTEASLKICGQFLACPFKCGDETRNKDTKDCSKRPHVISNSWGGYSSAAGFYYYYDMVEFWNSLGIISTFAAGNSGPGCTTSNPPGAYAHVLSVGAVDRNAVLAWFSSVGPVLSTKPLNKNTLAAGTCFTPLCPKAEKGCTLIKPDIVAPGYAINSSFNGNDTDYEILYGTSMATPHVTGVIALILCANNKVHWDYKEAYKILTETADTSLIDLLAERQAKRSRSALKTNLMCNVNMNRICNTYPNNMYGYGLAYACKAVIAAKQRKNEMGGLGWVQ